MKMQTIRLPSNNALRCRALAQENAALRAAAARWAKARRLALAGEIGKIKAAQGLPVLDEQREAEVLARRGDLLPQRRQQVERLFRLLMAESREEQERHG